MKAMYVYDIGDIVGDLECIDIKNLQKVLVMVLDI